MHVIVDAGLEESIALARGWAPEDVIDILVVRVRPLDGFLLGEVPVDVAIVVDASGSLVGPPGDAAAAAVRELVERLAPPHRVALVAAGSEPALLQMLRVATPSARAELRGRLEAARLRRSVRCGGSGLDSALDMAHLELKRAARPGARRRVVVVSDGAFDDPDGVASAAADLASSGVRLAPLLVESAFTDALGRNRMARLGGAGARDGLPGDVATVSLAAPAPARAAASLLASLVPQGSRPLKNVHIAIELAPRATALFALRLAPRPAYLGPVTLGKDRMWSPPFSPADAPEGFALGLAVRHSSGVVAAAGRRSLGRVLGVYDLGATGQSGLWVHANLPAATGAAEERRPGDLPQPLPALLAARARARRDRAGMASELHGAAAAHAILPDLRRTHEASPARAIEPAFEPAGAEEPRNAHGVLP